MRRPTLFIGLDGPLLIPSEKPHEYLGAGVAEYAKPFLGWAKEHFDIQVLTDDKPRHVHVLADHLNLPGDVLVPRGFDLLKTEAMRPDQEFFWVDAALVPGEIAWLGKNMIYHRFLSVDPTVGVTPQHKELLDNLQRNKKAIN